MLTLKAIQRRITALEAKAAHVASREKKSVLQKIAQLMTRNDISIADLKGTPRGSSKRKSALKGKKVKAMYRNPKTGETWSGRGRAARWLVAAEKAGHKRTEFLIKKG